MNYHFFIDEKFVDDFISDAKKIDSKQKFIVLGKKPLKFVSHPSAIHLNYGDERLDQMVETINADDLVFVHWFTPAIMELIDEIPSSTTVYLMFWGGDFLESNFPPGRLSHLNDFVYDPLTHKYINEFNIKRTNEQLKKRNQAAKESGNFKNIIHTRLQNIRLKARLNNGQLFLEEKNVRSRFLLRIEAICHWNQFDVLLLEKLYNVQLKQHYFVYNVGVNSLGEIESRDVNKELTIWLGNSDTPTNNHLDALTALEHLKDRPIKIICPLNYGDKEYGDLIEQTGIHLFGDKFVALRSYIDRDTYYSLMNQMDVAIMFHNRGQAGGNVIAFLKKGIKVYMKDQSSICQLFKEEGMQIHSANCIHTLSFEELKTPDSSDIVKKNIALINATIGNEEKRIKALEALLKGEDSN